MPNRESCKINVKYVNHANNIYIVVNNVGKCLLGKDSERAAKCL